MTPNSDPSTRHTKSSRTMTTTTSGTSKQVNRELKFDSPSLGGRQRQRSRSPNYQDHIESQVLRDVKYDTEPVLDTTPNSTINNRTYNYSKSSSNSRNNTPYNTEIVEMDTTDFPSELKDAPISNDLLPGPGTKVTTTVTYIYTHTFSISLSLSQTHRKTSSILKNKISLYYIPIFFIFFLFNRLKRTHTKYRMIKWCQRIKILHTKMNTTIQ